MGARGAWVRMSVGICEVTQTTMDQTTGPEGGGCGEKQRANSSTRITHCAAAAGTNKGNRRRAG